MDYEEYMKEIRAIESQMRESKIEESVAKNRAIEKCALEHRRLKMEMHDGVQRANMKRNSEVAEIHARYVDERNKLWERHQKLSFQWREACGLTKEEPKDE